MQKKIAAGLIGALSAINGLSMLAAAERWYEQTPGVSDTGPFNAHFVADIGAAYLIGGAALMARAWREAYWPAAIAAAMFFIAHALIHLAGILAGHSHHGVFETVAVILPALVAFWSATPAKGRRHA